MLYNITTRMPLANFSKFYQKKNIADNNDAVRISNNGIKIKFVLPDKKKFSYYINDINSSGIPIPHMLVYNYVPMTCSYIGVKNKYNKDRFYYSDNSVLFYKPTDSDIAVCCSYRGDDLKNFNI